MEGAYGWLRDCRTEKAMKEISILEVGGFAIGQAQDEAAGTGITVFLFDGCAPAGVDIRGGGPASRETPLLAATADAKGIHALVLSGGSAFGLDAAGGVMRFLEERGVGFDTGVTKVPLVCQSCLFDLAIGDMSVRPDADMAYRACENASRDGFNEGCFGAGIGATVGKFRGGEFAMKSGIGAYAVSVGDVRVGAVVAVNALGDIFDADTGKQIAGLRGGNGHTLASTEEALYEEMGNAHNLFTGCTNTTIGAVLTNAEFNKPQLTKIASMAHNGYARSIRPVHTTADGDSIYAVSTGHARADLNAVGTLSARVMAKAVARAVRAAKPMYGLPAVCSLDGTLNPEV